jgi:hypothetical protein
VLDGFENNYLKNGEWGPSGGGDLSYMIVACNQLIGALSCPEDYGTYFANK